MNNSNSTGSPSSHPAAPRDAGFSPWQRLKTKRISYLTLPLLFMATVTEFVILATGWKYQQVVCLPKGMAVTFLGIGPIGATILAVELLKLPLAIWTASRHGWQKLLMIAVGLPLICLLTFQLVKDMAVYEMGVALAPATQYLDEAIAEDARSAQLSAELKSIQDKKAEREGKLAELSAKQAKAKADLDDALKRNDVVRQDAISLTDYQRNQLNDVDARESAIIQQFNADTAQLNKTMADLQARRETEMSRDSRWNAEEARIDNEYKAKLANYQNKKAQYDKDKAAYDNANFLKRQLMSEPVDPGVPPVRPSNILLKSTLLADLDTQIKATEDQLLAADNKRRDRIAQVEADAHQLRSQFEGRSDSKRDEADRNRAQLLAAQAPLDAQFQAERKQIDDELAAAVQKVDGIQAELDASRKRAEGLYEQRELSIRNTQVNRIATTVEIIRGLIKGERPMSIKATAKERGDILTDQISMVRIWVYPVLAFIVAFLPTLMVEIGFSTVFEPEKQRPAHRLGFLGRRLHWLYLRAGRIKILRAERIAAKATADFAARNKALADAKAAAEQARLEKEAWVTASEEALAAAETERDAQLQKVEEEWDAKLATMADSLNRAVSERDALRDSQKSEVERQVQLAQNAWSDQLTQLRQELDDQRTTSNAERTAMMQAHHKEMLEVSEESKTQVIQARRQAAEAEMAAAAATTKLSQELKEAVHARDTAEAQLKQQADSFALRLQHAQDDAARELEKAAREVKHRSQREQLELGKIVQQQEEKIGQRLAQRERELSLAFDARLAEERARTELNARQREADLERQIAARALEVEAHAKQEMHQREETAQFKLRQREQQLLAQAEVRLSEVQAQAEQELRRREADFARQLEAHSGEAVARLKQEAQQRELAFDARLKQREQELAAQLTAQAQARQMAAQAHWEAESETKLRTVVEPLKAQLLRAEKERDEAKRSASEGTRHVQNLEKRLTEASSFLNTWRNGNSVVNTE